LGVARPRRSSHYELIGGWLFIVPPPDEPHGSIDARIVKSLVLYLAANDIEGEVRHPRESIENFKRNPSESAVGFKVSE
jgi:Uma2 family endonuclease